MFQVLLLLPFRFLTTGLTFCHPDSFLHLLKVAGGNFFFFFNFLPPSVLSLSNDLFPFCLRCHVLPRICLLPTCSPLLTVLSRSLQANPPAEQMYPLINLVPPSKSLIKCDTCTKARGKNSRDYACRVFFVVVYLFLRDSRLLEERRKSS